MLKRFISRKYRYAVKTLKSGAARVYVQNAEALKSAGLLAGTNVKIVYKKDRIDISIDKDGANRIMDTGRGELLELKNKETAKSLGRAEHVRVTFRKGKVSIEVYGLNKQARERELSLLKAITTGKPLRSACLFSGLGMLSYNLKQGLAQQGIQSEIVFANDNDELAMSCNLEGNPMWQQSSEDAQAVVDDLNELINSDIPQADMVSIGYPCVGFSALAEKHRRDLSHPDCGTLFVPLVSVLRKMNPAIMVFENTPRFLSSETYALIQRCFPDYHFSSTVLDGHDFNELESRKRACVVAISKGFEAFPVEHIASLFADEPQPTVNDILEPVSPDSPMYREMSHVKARDGMKHLGYRNCLYSGEETQMVTLPASYGNPKAGTPMIAHPTDPTRQRQVMPSEHANLRQLPALLKNIVMNVWKGKHPLVSKRGSASAAHRLLGNGVSRKVWMSLGSALGGHLNTNRAHSPSNL